MTPAGEIVQVDFFKSIIHSVAGLTYNEAQLMLDDPNVHDVKADSVRRLNELAKIFRKRRMDAGALTLASPEVLAFKDALAGLCYSSTSLLPVAGSKRVVEDLIYVVRIAYHAMRSKNTTMRPMHQYRF